MEVVVSVGVAAFSAVIDEAAVLPEVAGSEVAGGKVAELEERDRAAGGHPEGPGIAGRSATIDNGGVIRIVRRILAIVVLIPADDHRRVRRILEVSCLRTASCPDLGSRLPRYRN